MKLTRSKEWWRLRLYKEGDAPVAAGVAGTVARVNEMFDAGGRLAAACIELDNGYLRCLICRRQGHQEDGADSIRHEKGCALSAWIACANLAALHPSDARAPGKEE